MDRSTFNRLCKETWDRITAISDSKGKDYSGDLDVLKSFKTNAGMLDTTPEFVWGVLALKHWDAIMTFCRTGNLASEAIEGRLDDLIVYSLLLQAMAVERKNEADVQRAIGIPERRQAGLEGGSCRT